MLREIVRDIRAERLFADGVRITDIAHQVFGGNFWRAEDAIRRCMRRRWLYRIVGRFVR